MNEQQQFLNLSRRNLIKAGAGFLGAGTLATVIGQDLINSEPAVAQNNITPEAAFKKMMEGNKRFVQQKKSNPNRNTVRLKEVAKGQNPFAAVLSCADSRVPVEILFDQGLGDVFVVRNAGNVGTPEEIGSLEFGTLVLGAKVLMVIGHKSCGAVKATMEGANVPGSIGSILEQIDPAVTEYKGQQKNNQAVYKATVANVIFQKKRLEESPVISGLIKEGKLKLVGAYYDLDTGEIITVS